MVNRVYRGRTYYRWLLSVSPKEILQLGWVDGQSLRSYVRGSTLTIEPGVPVSRGRRGGNASNLEGAVRRRSIGSAEGSRTSS